MNFRVGVAGRNGPAEVGSGESQDRSAGGGLLPQTVTPLATQIHRDAMIDLSRLSGIVFQRVTNWPARSFEPDCLLV